MIWQCLRRKGKVTNSCNIGVFDNISSVFTINLHPPQVSDGHVCLLERFIYLFYWRTKMCESVNWCCHYLFQTKVSKLIWTYLQKTLYSSRLKVLYTKQGNPEMNYVDSKSLNNQCVFCFCRLWVSINSVIDISIKMAYFYFFCFHWTVSQDVSCLGSKM